MNSRVSWSVDGIEPSVRERAEAAARRAGMSLNDWLNSTIVATAPQPLPERDARDVAEIHQRLDSITRQIDQISTPTSRSEPAVANQLNDAISRLDARLSQLSAQTSRAGQAGEQPRRADTVERAAAQVYRTSPPLNPGSLESAIAEITARQSELDGGQSRAAPMRAAAPVAHMASPPVAPGPDFSSLERHLIKITSQIEALQPSHGIEQSIAAFRNDLAEIRQAIIEAMPRRAIESIENDIRALSRRIDETRHNGIDGNALANIERALNEIREALRSLKPAEQLAGYDEAIRNLGSKLDLIVRTSNDPATITQLENAITALRGIVSNVASNETLGRLSDDLRTLSSKVDQFARFDDGSSFAALEARMSGLTAALESRERAVTAGNPEHLEGTLRALSDRLDRIPVGADGASAFAHLEQRVSYLLERLEMSDARPGDLSRVESGLQDVLRHLERQQSNFSMLAAEPRTSGPTMDPAVVDAIKRELSDMRFSQSESERHTQDSLEVVHNTLGHVVDRLAAIEGDLRATRAAPQPVAAPSPVPQAPPSAAAEMPRPAAVQSPPLPPQPRPELPNPAASQFVAAPRQFAPAPPSAISDILDTSQTTESSTLGGLPPDHPLEPGTRPPSRAASASDRIGAPDGAAGEPASASSFIAAARRAAQAAAASGKDKTSRTGSAAAEPVAGTKPGAGGSTITSKIRSLLVGASVVVIVLGSFRVAMNLLDGVTAQPQASIEQPQEAPPPAAAPEAPKAQAPAPVPAMPSMTSPTPIGKQSQMAPQLDMSPIPQAADVTGTVSPAAPAVVAAAPVSTEPRKLAQVPIPAGEKLPDGIGGPVLRAAALKGDPSAAYEIGMRYAEGRGVPANFDEAFKWYDRSAQAGIVPAIFRLGTLYEKGLSVKKDADAARRYYIQAAERGNAKAMHNLAVLEADGGGRGANYKSAAQWFRKAADRGVPDSQFNLGILYARGIGVEQNLAESFKWFSLAAAQGDADAGRKRDDVAKRLDPQSLAAAKLAIQTFVADAQPDDAVAVSAPAGGWDAAPTQAAAKPNARRAAR